MAGLPVSLAIGFWVTGATWVLAILAYLADATDWIFPLFLFGALTGIAEWLIRQKAN